jgi:hypothetical protein
MKSIQTQAVITGIRSKVDRSLGLSVSTPELSINEKAMFMELQGLNVDLTITPLDEANPEKEKIDREMDTKTSSQRLRSVLFVLYKQEDEANKLGNGANGKITFDEFYRNHMEKYIDHVKGKLDQ